MIGLLARVWQTLTRPSSGMPQPDPVDIDDDTIDQFGPEEDQLARWLWAMCCGRADDGLKPTNFALAAMEWLTNGRLVLPEGARPLDPAARQALPVPYRDRAPV